MPFLLLQRIKQLEACLKWLERLKRRKSNVMSIKKIRRLPLELETLDLTKGNASWILTSTCSSIFPMKWWLRCSRAVPAANPAARISSRHSSQRQEKWRRFDRHMKDLGLQLLHSRPKAFCQLQTIFALPSTRTLRRYVTGRVGYLSVNTKLWN